MDPDSPVSQGAAMIAALTLSLVLTASPNAEPGTELLYPKGAPGALGEKDADKPSITVYQPAAEKANGTAVVVCPGGGYGTLAVDHEGKQVAEWFTERGVTAFVLRYRVAPYRHPVPLQDAQRALRTVRSRA